MRRGLMRWRKEHSKVNFRFQIFDFGFEFLHPKSQIVNLKSHDTDEGPVVVFRREQPPDRPGEACMGSIPKNSAGLADGSLFPGGPPCPGREVRDFPV